MTYDQWLQKPYTDTDKPHFADCAWHEDNDPSDDAECTCEEIEKEEREYAADQKFDEMRDARALGDL